MSDAGAERHINAGSTSFVEDVLVHRRAADFADFLLPHVAPGQRLLDCGCGPGTITADLAAVVAPGLVVGLDRDLAALPPLPPFARCGADMYMLPFPDSSFDSAFAHAVLVHLRDPLAALRELRRVLRPGGLVAVRDCDWDRWFLTLSTARLEEGQALFLRAMR